MGYATSNQLRPKAAYATSVETSVYLAPDADARGIRTLLHKRLFESLEGGEVHRDDVARFERHLV